MGAATATVIPVMIPTGEWEVRPSGPDRLRATGESRRVAAAVQVITQRAAVAWRIRRPVRLEPEPGYGDFDVRLPWVAATTGPSQWSLRDYDRQVRACGVAVVHVTGSGVWTLIPEREPEWAVIRVVGADGRWHQYRIGTVDPRSSWSGSEDLEEWERALTSAAVADRWLGDLRTMAWHQLAAQAASQWLDTP